MSKEPELRVPSSRDMSAGRQGMARMADFESLDINSDMGESFGNWSIGDDQMLMSIITTANIACGFHAGDPATMSRTVALAKQHGVVVGAHPGVPDLLGFGRRYIALT